MCALIHFEFVFHVWACCFSVVWHVPRIMVFTVLSAGFPYFTNIVQLLCSLRGWLHLHSSSIGTGFNRAKTNCRTAHDLSILLTNSNCFAIFFSSILVMSVQISRYIQLVNFNSSKTAYNPMCRITERLLDIFMI